MQHATDALLKFRDERNWKQFHDPKNLAAALGIEAAELNEVFLWKTTEESREVELAQGTYLFGPLTGPKRQVQILD